MRPLPPFAGPSVFIAAAVLTLSACDRAETPSTPAAAPAQPAPTPLQPVVDRAEMLRTLDAAASAFAAGQPLDSASLDGRRFSIRQAFGCAGAAPRGAFRPPGLASWSWGERNQTIELALQPADWTAELTSGEEDAAEAIEGFWLARPWMRTDGCPTVTAPVLVDALEVVAPTRTAAQKAAPSKAGPSAEVAPPPPAPVPRQTAGLASVFAQGGSRVGRRDGRAFTYTVRGENGAPPPPPTGYRLVIEGRFTAFPGGPTVRCRAAGPEERPVCLAASTIDRVVFETAGGQMLSEWRPG